MPYIINNRTSLINELIKKYNYKSYLEIGCGNNLNFNQINIDFKIGVDPNPVNGGIKSSSDDFFKTNQNYFDIIFIDGLHLYEQVIKDIDNSLNFLNENGTIVIHDCCPINQQMQLRKDNGIAWTGDVWRSIIYFRQKEDIYTSVLKFDFGCGVIRKTKNTNILEKTNHETIPYELFESNKKHYLNLFDFDDIESLFGPPNKIKISIVIPTYNHLDDCLRPCLESIKQYTDLSDIEVIVVANGCIDNTREYVESLGEPFKLLWIEEQFGYTKSTNAGINISNGDYVLLLNNDCEIYGSNWIELLLEPFSKYENVGITGNHKHVCDQTGRNFLIGYCVLVKREVFDKLGILDEIFSPGFGEDIDLCIRAENAGYKVLQTEGGVGIDAYGRRISHFPICHKAEQTFHDTEHKEAYEIIVKRNQKILKDRYGVVAPENIIAPQKNKEQDYIHTVLSNVKGFFTFYDAIAYRKLAKQIKNGVIIEIGSYAGASALCIADICKENNNTLYCVDTWEGSPEHQNGEAYAIYNTNELFDVFKNNIKTFGYEDIVSTVKRASIEAAKHFEAMDIKADMIFIDADHSYECVCQDIDAWLPIVKTNGIMAGHDIDNCESVPMAVKEKIKNFHTDAAIWIRNNTEAYIETKKVTVVISTKNRYYDTLPLTLNSLCDQTCKDFNIMIFDDNTEPIDLRTIPIYNYILNRLNKNEINWEVVYGQKRGQVANHNMSLEIVKTDLIWRLDDDECPEPNVLEVLLSNFKEDTGAVSCCILNSVTPPQLPTSIPKNKIEKIFTQPNIQWFEFSEKIEVEHLYSSFLYDRKKGKAIGGYNKDLSPIGHREETLFTYELFKAGYKLIVDHSVKIWHYQNPNGGIRSDSHMQMWAHDDEIFRKYLDIDNLIHKDKFYVVLMCGLGDHFAFLHILPEIKEKYKDKKIIVANCFPDIFEEYLDEQIELISIEEIQKIIGYNLDKYNIYGKMREWNFEGSLSDAFRRLYL